MQDIVIDELNNMRETIVRNIDSMKPLHHASVSIGNSINKLSQKDLTDEEVPALLQTLHKDHRQIDDSMLEILNHIKSLLDAYEKIAKNI